MRATISYVNKHINLKLLERGDFIEALEAAREEIRKEELELIKKPLEG